MIAWPDPVAGQKSQALREILTQLLVETDPGELDRLVAVLARNIKRQLHPDMQN
jgi:hypothetical protein